MNNGRTSLDNNELIIIRDEFYLPLVNDWSTKRLNIEDDNGRDRNDYQRDYTRIIYSSSFRRLQGKMQLLGVDYDKFFRNRLTHSIEVAQIARSIAEDIGHDIMAIDSLKRVYIEDLYVVESCALAHDIGNPPFGHKGERVLHSICSDGIGFEGNAQTLRILMDLEKKFPLFGGLNLTLRTLLGVTKYFKKYEATNSSKGSRKFIYYDTYSILREQIQEHKISIRTLDVQIVDLSDEIAYAAHDLEDALSMNLFTIDDLLYEFMLLSTKEEYKEAYTQLEEIVKKARNCAIMANRFSSSEEYSFLFRKELTSLIVNILIKDIRLVDVDVKHKNKTGTTRTKELGFREYKGLAKGLKDKVFDCINRKNNVQLYEAQGEKIIKGLFDVFIENDNYMPVEFRYNNSCDLIKKRKVIDYISGMMDSYAISTYTKFFGASSLDGGYFEKKKATKGS